MRPSCPARTAQITDESWIFRTSATTPAGPARNPRRQPARPKDLEKELTVMTDSRAPGTEAGLSGGWSP